MNMNSTVSKTDIEKYSCKRPCKEKDKMNDVYSCYDCKKFKKRKLKDK